MSLPVGADQFDVHLLEIALLCGVSGRDVIFGGQLEEPWGRARPVETPAGSNLLSLVICSVTEIPCREGVDDGLSVGVDVGQDGLDGAAEGDGG